MNDMTFSSSTNTLLKPFAKSELLRPLAIFFLDSLLYIGTLAGALLAKSPAVGFGLSILAGLASGTLFVVGHDACHGSFTRYKWLNLLIGRLALLPTLHSFSLWYHGHNRIHHRHTNVASIDYVYTPLSKAQYDARSPFGRWFYRAGRSWWGHGLYYTALWAKKMVFPAWAGIARSTSTQRRDTALVITYGTLFIAALVHWFGWLGLLFGFIVPFSIWNWLMGFVIFQHHTEPEILWHENEKDWNYLKAQVEETAHVKFPRIINFSLHNIMEHPAHHALTSIPMYRLKAAQDALNEAQRERVTIVEWNFNLYAKTLRICRLYDYDNHRWLDYDGRISDTGVESKLCPPAETTSAQTQ